MLETVTALPLIQRYALPTADELPAARVPWQPSRHRAALLVHDMQRYFLNAFAPDADQIVHAIANIHALRTHCARLDIPVIYTVQPGEQDARDRGLQRDFWGPGMGSTVDHEAVVDTLQPRPGDIVLTKWRYSAFQRTNLESVLRARGRDQLLITGVYGHIGCMLTAAESFMRDIEPFVVGDAIADFSREKHDMALSYVAERCAVPVTTARLLESLP